MTPSPGSRLGPYEILGQIGAGGMGEVYRAKDPRLGRDVAIKVLPASFSADANCLRRFEQEAKAAGLLNQSNIGVVSNEGKSLLLDESGEAGGPRGSVSVTPDGKFYAYTAARVTDSDLYVVTGWK